MGIAHGVIFDATGNAIMEKSTALNQIVQLLTLTASYIQANDVDRVMASLSIVADVMEEGEVAPSDIEVLLQVVPEEPSKEVTTEPSLRDRIERMVNSVNNAQDDDRE